MENQPRCFQNSITIKTRFSNFYKVTIKVLKTYLKKQNLNYFFSNVQKVRCPYVLELQSQLKYLLLIDNSLKGF